MRFGRFPLLFLTVCGAALAVPAFAQEKVGVRGGDHEAYSRIVFEWADKPGYSLSKDGNRVLIRFAKAGALDLAGFEKEKNIGGVKVLSSGTEPLQVAIDIPQGSRFRDFVVGSKLIVDVYDNSFDEAAPAKTTQKEPDVKPVAEEKKQQEKNSETPKGDFTRKPAENAKPAPIETVETEQVPAPAFDTHVITIRHITSSGIAAFERFGRLWIALDSEEENVAPVLEGTQTAQLGGLKKLDGADGGSVYYIDLPEGVKAYGQGGGLSWRVLLSDKDKDMPFAVPSAVHEGGASALSWPLENMRKKITFTDPMAGDVITAITASDSSQRGGPVRHFVNLDTLESDVGFAYVAKSDGVEPKILKDEVRIETPGGLAVSSSLPVKAEGAPKQEEKKAEADPHEAPEEQAHADDHKKEYGNKDLSLTEEPPAVDKKHGEEGTEDVPHDTPHEVGGEEAHEVQAATSEEMAKVAGEKPKGNNIYNFPRWEMGGLQPLEKNIHILMVEAAGKPAEAKPEDVITMAKLLIANNRGPEALGMMRIALQKVPDLDQDKEFQALRGAALAISGKFDESFADLSNENLNAYDDIKLWRAFSLGGLEDWKQAGEVLPADVSAIKSYPKAIRAQLALMFAEIDLRNARVDDAGKNLDMLKPELKTLRPAYIAAWNYLTGELERQKGHADKATEYWEPLVKNGKDDLYRAKAGLSLTKLQIEQKKLSAEQAINRLEGLRYAWRGDELETLINYRLGQLYIDNKDYLKGLTVLRNAVTLTPELQVGQDVQTYMTKAFRDIFVKNEISKVSPLDAIGIYEEFKDLFPPGAEADEYIEKLSERLVDADLLGRAASLLEFQVNNRLTGNKKVETAIRLAAIRLLDGNPQGALRALEVAQDTYNKVANGTAETTPPNPALPDIVPQAGDATVAAPAVAKEKADPELERQILLLKARALSMEKKTDDALAILNAMPPDTDVSRLRTDIAWFAGNWEEAAMSLNELIVYEDISPKRPLTEYQRDLILNRAIALNLSGNRVGLANLRERYNTQMKDTAKGEMFEVVTRPRRPDMIGSREAIDSMISEIDLFKGFLDNYKTMTGKKTPGAAAPAKAPASAEKQAPTEKQDSTEKTEGKKPEEAKAAEEKPVEPATH